TLWTRGWRWCGMAFVRQRSGSITRRSLPWRIQCFEERHERSSFWGAQVFSVSRHIAAALDHLSNQLIMCESYSDCIERRTTLSTFAVECMAVVALLDLKDQRALTLQSRAHG